MSQDNRKSPRQPNPLRPQYLTHQRDRPAYELPVEVWLATKLFGRKVGGSERIAAVAEYVYDRDRRVQEKRRPHV